jgi:hypothetical protein
VGLHIERNRATRTLNLSRWLYIEDLLKLSNIADADPGSNPTEPGVNLHCAAKGDPQVSSQHVCRGGGELDAPCWVHAARHHAGDTSTHTLCLLLNSAIGVQDSG